MNDAELIIRIQERDEAVLPELETKYGRRLGRTARNILKNEDDVLECLNDVYLKAWNSIPSAHPENLEAYLTTLTRNTALNRIRDGNARKRIPQELIMPLDEAPECEACFVATALKPGKATVRLYGSYDPDKLGDNVKGLSSYGKDAGNLLIDVELTVYVEG